MTVTKKDKNNQNNFGRPRNQQNKKSKNEFEEKIIDWVTFYRRNMHRFVEHYLGLELFTYQIILIYLMNLCSLVVVVACRASAKSYLIAIYACSRCILYPNSKIVIASSTKKQASLIVTEKIQKELIPNSPNLEREIKTIRTGVNETEVVFHNGSSIIVVPANENARGFRGTVNIYEEFRMIKKEVVDSVLSPFLIVRQPPYLKNPKYSHLKEEPIEIYISSAYFKAHWMWEMMKIATMDMYKKGEGLIIGFDYAITLKHGIRTPKQLVKEKKKLGNMAFDMEYGNLMVGATENAYYTFDLLNQAQQRKKAFYPRNNIDVIEKRKNKYDIPKQNGEIRVVAVDIAMVVNAKRNDNTAISCIRALPVKDTYEREVPYIETMQGGNTTVQATRIKEIFTDFDADYIVIDGQNAGISVIDEMGKITYDEQRDCEYPAYTCFNDENTANRIKNSNALPVIFCIKANAGLNQEIHITMKDNLERNKIKLLINSTQAKDYLDTKREYVTSDSIKKGELELAYFQTDLLINEMINLSYEINKNNNQIKLYEPKNGTKDRYISLAYGNFFISTLERDLNDNGKDFDAARFFFFN